MGGKHILVVEDDPDIAMANQFLLEQAGYRVSMAESTAGAWNVLADGSVDLIILDVMLTYPTEGFHFATELAGDRRFKDIPIVVATVIEEYSGRTPYSLAERQPLPVAAFMRKPVEPQKLLAKVEQLLDGNATAARGEQQNNSAQK